MKGKFVIFGAGIAAFIGIILVILCTQGTSGTSLEFRVIDVVSKNWVWDFTAKLQDRFIKGYYQSNTGPVVYRFTGLKPGNWTLELDAPGYVPVEFPVQIKDGKNNIESPIEMTGYEIPGLVEIFVFKEWIGNELILNPRPIDAEGLGIGTHPCLDMWFGLKISVQVKNGILIKEPTEKGSERGEELFKGKCEWEWDPDPDTYYRYLVKVPFEKVKKHNAPYHVYDYVIVFPDSRKISRNELESKMEKALSLPGEAELRIFLDSLQDKITYFISTDWNQPAGK
ncbi:MAG: carboxypeptidase regulatory-like domain-containing protein [Spirochaetales bacterium]|nr:carboxypeptidase regulatory-like domain-containing protein [Spirochaetales bacterium]